jgi:hypothetical protein
MVKNTSGGNKAKSFARKHYNQQNNNFILPSSQLEIFASVHKIYGNGIILTFNPSYGFINTHIRHKFSARNKRDNLISIGNIIIIGLREWEHPFYKNADLIYVFDHKEIQHIKNSSIIDYPSFFQEGNTHNDNDIIFNDSTDTFPNIDSSNANISNTSQTDTILFNNTAIDFNDI